MARPPSPAGVLFALALIAVAPGPIAAAAEEDTFTVSGTVVEARSGAPVPGALVLVRGPGGGEAVTGADGRFGLPGVPAGTRAIRILMLGYAVIEREVDVPAAAPLSFALTESPPSFEEAVAVRGEAFTAREVGVPSEVSLGSADLALLRGVLADDPFRAVHAMPGVASGDDFTAEFSIRGGGPSTVAVLVDDVPAPVVLHTVQGRGDTGSVSMINGDLLSEVTVSGGSHAATSGNRLGGRVEFHTREGSRDRTQVRAQAGLAVASVTAEGPFGDGRQGSWLVAGRYSYAGWISRRVDPSLALSFVFADVIAKLAWDPSPAHHLTLLAIAGRMAVRERQEENRVNVLDEGMNESATLVASWRWQASPRLVVTQHVTGLYNRFANTNPFGDELGRGRVTGGGYRVGATWTRGDRWLLQAGGSTDQRRDEVRLLGRSTRAPFMAVVDFVEAAERQWGAFAQVTATPVPRLTWSAGARADASMATRFGTAAPWANAAWSVADGWRVRGGAGGYSQFPDLLQSSGWRGGGDLPPAEAVHLDLALERRASPSWRWQVGAYRRDERNGLRLPAGEPRLVGGRFVSASTTSLWDARLESDSTGVEVLAHRRSPTGVSGWLAYSYGLTRTRDTVTGERFAGDFDQRHTLNAFASWRASHRFGASARVRYGSGLPVIGYYTRVADAEDGEPRFALSAWRNQARYPAYARLDVRVERAFVRGERRMTVFAETVNVLGRDNYGPGGAGAAEKLLPFVPSAGLLVEW